MLVVLTGSSPSLAGHLPSSPGEIKYRNELGMKMPGF